jgi:hypothetical protein
VIGLERERDTAKDRPADRAQDHYEPGRCLPHEEEQEAGDREREITGARDAGSPGPRLRRRWLRRCLVLFALLDRGGDGQPGLHGAELIALKAPRLATGAGQAEVGARATAKPSVIPRQPPTALVEATSSSPHWAASTTRIFGWVSSGRRRGPYIHQSL